VADHRRCPTLQLQNKYQAGGVEIVTGAVGLGTVDPIHAIGYVGNNIGSAVGVFGAAFL